MATSFRKRGTFHVAWVLLLLLLWGSSRVAASITTTSGGPYDTSPPASFVTMREALQHALHLRFTPAFEAAKSLEKEAQTTFEAALAQGIIAYFQARWQTRPVPVPTRKGPEFLLTILEKGQQQLAKTPRDARLKLLLGTASIMQALFQPEGRWWPQAEVAQGRAWLQQALIAEAAFSDAYFGLGLAYLVTTNMAPWARLLASAGGELSAEEAIHHLQRAATSGQFSRDVARTFLLRLYEVEKRYPEALTLAQELQELFPENGYYALFTGRMQYAAGQHAACATTLARLAAAIDMTPERLAHRDDRFDLYYVWGRALLELAQDALALQALRAAINVDPAGSRDESLWARYYVATLYERRGDLKIARQMYETLLRRRNVDTLHQQIRQRLAHTP